MTKDLFNLSNLYESVLIRESNSLPPDVKQKLDLFLNSEDGKKFLSSLNQTSKQIEQVAQRNPKEASQVSESVINEALPARLVSQIAGWKRGIQGQRVGEEGEKLDVQSHQVNKRFEILQKKLGSHLKELQRDLSSSSQADDTVKKEIDQMISSLESEHSIKPTESKFQDIRHSIGKGVEWTGKAATLGGIGALLGGAVASLGGIAGIPALAIKGAVAAATRKVAADLLKGQKPNTKQVLIQSLIGAGGGAAFGLAAPLLSQYSQEISDYVSGRSATTDYAMLDKGILSSPEGSFDEFGVDQSTSLKNSSLPPKLQQTIDDRSIVNKLASEPLSTEPTTQEIQSSIKSDWSKLSKTVFGREGLEGTVSNLSAKDNAVLDKLTQEIKDKNLDWTKLSLKQKAALFDPIVKQISKR